MKKLLLLLLCVPLIGFGQVVWQSKIGEDSLNGQYKIAYISEYNTPYSDDTSQLFVKFLKDSNDLVLYINSPDFLSGKEITSLYLFFDKNCVHHMFCGGLLGLGSKLYVSGYNVNFMIDSNNENRIILSDFHIFNTSLLSTGKDFNNNPKLGQKLDIINQLMTSEDAYFCISYFQTRGKWDFVNDNKLSPSIYKNIKFSLKGSSKAIHEAIPDIDSMLKKLSDERKANRDLMWKNIQLNFPLLLDTNVMPK
jgi:hypothetical protein